MNNSKSSQRNAELFAEWFYSKTNPGRNSEKDVSQPEKKVFLVTGAPGAGKTTYVRNKKQPGDLILDLDALAAALHGITTPHPDYEPVMDAVLAAREAVYSVIENRKGRWDRAFVITSAPDPRKVDALATRLGATVITMQTTKQKCIEQIQNDPTREMPDNDLRLVDEWYTMNKGRITP